jgi:hypothetical protein
MKKSVLIGLLLYAILSITVYAQKEKEQVRMKVNKMSDDSTSYELLVTDTGFESWFLTVQVDQYTPDFYHLKNIQYVDNWNNLFMSQENNGGLITSRIEYDPSAKYPFELESKLYWYFVYFEETNHIKLLP